MGPACREVATERQKPLQKTAGAVWGIAFARVKRGKNLGGSASLSASMLWAPRKARAGPFAIPRGPVGSPKRDGIEAAILGAPISFARVACSMAGRSAHGSSSLSGMGKGLQVPADGIGVARKRDDAHTHSQS